MRVSIGARIRFVGVFHMKIRRKITLILVVLIAVVGCFFYVYDQVYLATGVNNEKKVILIEKGDNALVVGGKLSKAGIITGKYFLAYYLWKNNQLHDLVAGVYTFSMGLKIPEVSRMITGGETTSTAVPVTFPEGWTARQMAGRLDANGFSGSDFLTITKNPASELKDKYRFLSDLSDDKSLEGYLFPDTYYFAKDATAQDIVEKMLKNFDARISESMLADVAVQKKSLYDIVTMASIVEGEVKTDSDRKIVAGIFYNRLEIGMTLGSDATLEYVLGTNKFQHSIAETKIDSPYNTYLYKGLPPGPVSNPGLNSILAAINPANTDFVYFLTDPKTGNTAFAKTFEQHIANKAKYGL